MGERLVIKVGTNVLTQPTQQLDYNIIHQMVEQIGLLRKAGHQVVLVSSGAAGAAYGLGPFEQEKQTLLRRQMQTAVGQPRLMQIYADFFREQQINVAQILLTRSDFADRERYLSIRNATEGLLRMGIVPIVNENDVVASEELTFGDNDYLAAAVASMMGANRLFLLTIAEGFFAGGAPDGAQSPTAEPLREVQEITPEMWDWCSATISTGGRGGMFSKLKSVEMVTSFGVEAYIASGKTHRVVPRIMEGEALGTRFYPTAKRLKSYRQWLRFGALTKGQVVVDAGAAKALSANKSLLPQGVKQVEGAFEAGDIVDVLSVEGERLGVGLVNHSERDLRAALEGQPLTGPQEVIHKDRLLLV